MAAFIEKKNNCYNNSKGSFKDYIHILEKGRDKLQIHIL